MLKDGVGGGGCSIFASVGSGDIGQGSGNTMDEGRDSPHGPGEGTVQFNKH